MDAGRSSDAPGRQSPSRYWLFLVEGVPSPNGLRCADIQDATLSDLEQTPGAVDWLFPADRYFVDNSTAPAESSELIGRDLSAKYRDGLARQQLLRNYGNLLDTCGLIVDHHGFVFRNQSKWVVLDQWTSVASWLDLALARVLRSLSIAGILGYSQTGYGKPSDYNYALGLHGRLVEDVSLRRKNPEPALALWKEAAGLE